MRRLRGLSLGGRLVLALAVGGAIFGIAGAVQASIPDAKGVIHGCYGKAGTPYKGNLRLRDAGQGEQCRMYENPLNWNQQGPTGTRGTTGPTARQARKGRRAPVASAWKARPDHEVRPGRPAHRGRRGQPVVKESKDRPARPVPRAQQETSVPPAPHLRLRQSTTAEASGSSALA